MFLQSLGKVKCFGKVKDHWRELSLLSEFAYSLRKSNSDNNDNNDNCLKKTKRDGKINSHPFLKTAY